MSLEHLLPPRTTAVRRFPPNDHGVLLPLADRRTAALGVGMYTASSPRALAVQQAAYWAVRAVGARVLPGGTQPLDLPGDADTWSALAEQWTEQLGRLDHLAVYRRRQQHRVGLTMVAVGAGRPVAVLKVRDAADGLEREQQALRALEEHRPTTFAAPRALGSGRAGTWSWSAQECVFERPHRPVLTAPRALFDEVSALLAPLAGGSPGTTGAQVPAHHDLTPWNLRRDHRGAVWLFDWEDWGLGPVDADRTYFAACARAVRGTPLPGDLPSAAIAYHRPIVEARRRLATPGDGLDAAILTALDEAEDR